METLNEWLPREKLYAMPRSLQTQGSRALGRLAFTENQQRLLARLRRDIQEISKSETIYESVNRTGLAFCNSTPRALRTSPLASFFTRRSRDAARISRP